MGYSRPEKWSKLILLRIPVPLEEYFHSTQHFLINKEQCLNVYGNYLDCLPCTVQLSKRNCSKIRLTVIGDGLELKLDNWGIQREFSPGSECCDLNACVERIIPQEVSFSRFLVVAK